jgi:hypothetical protein
MGFDRSGACVLVFALAACGGGGHGSSSNPAPGTLEVVVTDAPLDHAMTREVRVWIDRVTVAEFSGGSRAPRILYDGAPIEVDLMKLRNGLVQTLAAADLPDGEYRELRLYVDHASLTLVSGMQYTTGAGTLATSADMQDGVPVFLDPPLVVATGTSRTLLLDVDLGKSFLPDTGGDALWAHTYRMHPVIRAADLATSGEVRGVVRRNAGGGRLVPVGDATIYLMPPGASELSSSLASTSSSADGSYAVLGVPRGTIDVLATHGALEAHSDGEQVTSNAVTIVDFLLQ